MESQIQFVLPKRPIRSTNKRPTNCQELDLITNNYPITFAGGKLIYQYDLGFEPEIDPKARAFRGKIINNIYDKIKADLVFFKLAGNNLYSIINKDAKPVEYKVYTAKVGNDQEFAVKIKLVKKWSMEDSQSQENQGYSSYYTMIFNIMIKNIMKEMGYQEYGMNGKFFDPKKMYKYNVENQEQDYHMNVWHGFKTSVFLAQKQAMLQIDFSSRVIRQETAFDILADDRLSDDDKREELEGKTVIGTYGNYQNFKVSSIEFKMSPSKSTFDVKGVKTNYVDYYKQKYNIVIKNKNSPLIKVIDKKTKQEIFIIPELVQMTGLTDNQRSNGKLMRTVAEHTKLEPSDRMKIIQNQAKILQENKKNDNPIEIDIKKNSYQGFVLDAPALQLANESTQPSNGSWKMQDYKLYKPSRIQNWVLIYASFNKQNDEEADDLVDTFKKCSKAFGIQVDEPAFLTVNKSNRPDDWIKVLSADIKSNGKPSIVVSLIERKYKESLYNRLKEFFNVEQGVPHQNVVKDSLRKNQMAVCSKILLQMNVKLGDPLWIVPPVKGISQKTMLIGIDVYKKLIKNKQSCVGFVATMDANFTSFYSRIIMQKPNEELIKNLPIVIQDALKTYYKINKEFPDTVIIYRDGVGEGQIKRVLELENQGILNAFSAISPDYKPQFAHILINKKINNRFFSNQSSGGGRGGKGQSQGIFNPPSGTIVADEIVSSNFEFMLAAQQVTQGTCTPTKYLVVYNSTSWTEEQFWKMTYYQCFNYYNWNGAVRVPAVTQYAHKLAFLIGDTYQENSNEALWRFLYFL